MNYYNNETILEMQAKIDSFPAELEAQHRKTWALAMKGARELCRLYGDKSGWFCDGAISALPCPPIEATKDK